jgi:hypothetical protein
MKRSLLFAALLAMVATASAQVDVPRAVRNYQAVVRGEIQLHDLSPAEQAEVREVDRRLKAEREGPPETQAEKCRRQRAERAETPSSELERAITDLACGRE